jgi:hypothetical protein
VYKLRKALYGLKQAPRSWYDRLRGFLFEKGFEMGKGILREVLRGFERGFEIRPCFYSGRAEIS